jgi:hypothetical protein
MNASEKTNFGLPKRINLAQDFSMSATQRPSTNGISTGNLGENRKLKKQTSFLANDNATLSFAINLD